MRVKDIFMNSLVGEGEDGSSSKPCNASNSWDEGIDNSGLGTRRQATQLCTQLVSLTLK
jgi:hypothetical protein